MQEILYNKRKISKNYNRDTIKLQSLYKRELKSDHAEKNHLTPDRKLVKVWSRLKTNTEGKAERQTKKSLDARPKTC